MKRRGFLSFLGVGAGASAATIAAGASRTASATDASPRVPEVPETPGVDPVIPPVIRISAPAISEKAVAGDLVTHMGMSQPDVRESGLIFTGPGSKLITAPADCRGAPHGSPHVIGIQQSDGVLYQAYGPIPVNFQKPPSAFEVGNPVFLGHEGKATTMTPNDAGCSIMKIGILAQGGEHPLVHMQLQFLGRRA